MSPQDHSFDSRRMPQFPTDLDDLRATDKCPMCFAPTERSSTCPECGLNLTDPTLAEVFTQSSLAADALVARGNLVANVWRKSVAKHQDAPEILATEPTSVPVPEVPAQVLPAQVDPTQVDSAWETTPQEVMPRETTGWEQAAPAFRGAEPVPSSWPAPAPAPTPAPAPAPQGRPAPQTPTPTPTPTPSDAGLPSKPRRSGIQLTLLVLGVSFVSIAAIVFLTVAFVLFDLTVKAIITAGVTAGVIALASWLKRKQLTATAEGIAILGVVLLLLDLWAVRSLNLFGLGGIEGTLFWGVSLLLMTGILLGWGKLSSLRSPRIASTFTIAPGIFAMLRWIFDWVFTDHSSMLIALAGVALASLMAPILHRRNDQADPVEVGIVFGVGQISGLVLFVQALANSVIAAVGSAAGVTILAAHPHPLQEPTVATVTGFVGIGAMLGHLRLLRRHDSLEPINWMRIPATILATLLWSGAMIVMSTELVVSHSGTLTGQPDARDLWKAIPFAALAAVYWDVRHLRAGLRDRAQWRTGMITTAAITLLPVIWLIVGVLQVPAMRSINSGTNWPLHLAGIAIVVAAALAALAYRLLADTAPGYIGRIQTIAAVGASGISISAIAMSRTPSLVTLGLLMLLAVVGAWLIRRTDSVPLSSVISSAFTAGAAGLVLVTSLHRPESFLAFCAIGIGFLLLRLFRGSTGPTLLTLAAALFAFLTAIASWEPSNFPVTAAIAMLAFPTIMLLIAAGARQLDVTDRRILAWTATLLLFVATTQQFALAFVDLDGSFGNTLLSTCIAAGIAAIGYGALITLALRARRDDSQDALTHVVTLSSTFALGYIAVSPFVQILSTQQPTPVAEILLAWTPLMASILSAALLTLLRVKGVPDLWTRAGDCIAVVIAGLAILSLFIPALPLDDELKPTSFFALLIAIAVPLTVTVRSSGQSRRGRFRGAYPWISAAYLALFGPLLIARVVDAPWPLLVAAPIVIALLASALVFHVSGAARRLEHGDWLLGGMLASGIALALGSLLGSRSSVFEDLAWPVSAIAAALSLTAVLFIAASKNRPRGAIRDMLVSTLAPLSALSLIVFASDVLESLANAGTRGTEITAATLAVAIGGATFITARTVLGRLEQADAPGRLLRWIGFGAIALVSFSALILAPASITAAVIAWSIALALALLRASPGDTPLASTASWATDLTLRILSGIALLTAAVLTLVATQWHEHLVFPWIAGAATLLGLTVTALILGQELRAKRSSAARSLPSRVVSAVLVPVGGWAALMATPIAWPWWMLVATAVVALGTSVGVAVFRHRVDESAVAAAGIATLLPIATALFISDPAIRTWPFTWLVVGISLVAFGYAVTSAFAGAFRGVGVLLALISSGVLLWPDAPGASVLWVAAPGCVLLAVMATASALTSSVRIARAQPHSVPGQMEAGLYAAAIPLWFAGIALAASNAIPGRAFPIIMIAMLCLSIAAIAVVAFTEAKLPQYRLPLYLLAGGAGIASLAMCIAALSFDSDTPADVYSLAIGLALTTIGALWMRARPAVRSFPALGPGLVSMLLPLWFIEAGDANAVRIGVYTALVLAAVLMGALAKLQAPLVLGAIAAVAHLIVAIRWMLPELSVPWWIWLGASGALLIFVAATYESRLKNAKTLVTSISQLR